MAESFLQIGVVALPLLCLVVSKIVNGSAFIAAFLAGLTTQIGFKEAGKHSVEFAVEWGQLLNFAVFFLFGLAALRALLQVSLVLGLDAVLSLTELRMLPVGIELIGMRLSLAAVV